MSAFIHIPHEFPTLERESKGGLRWYITPEGKKYPSVTTVLDCADKPGLEKWKAAMGDKKSKRIAAKSAERGTQLHEMCERYIKNEEFDPFDKYNSDAIKMFHQMRMRIKGDLGDVHAQEQAMYSDALGIAGTVDLIGMWKDELTVVDFKTSISDKRKQSEQIQSYLSQCAAYAVMFEEMTGMFPEKIVILLVSEKGLFPQVFSENTVDHLRHIMKCKRKFYEKLAK
jgi:CRISPR/Cas system-associated exonuclease Cas4 (RecB family)